MQSLNKLKQVHNGKIKMMSSPTSKKKEMKTLTRTISHTLSFIYVQLQQFNNLSTLASVHRYIIHYTKNLPFFNCSFGLEINSSNLQSIMNKYTFVLIHVQYGYRTYHIDN